MRKFKVSIRESIDFEISEFKFDYENSKWHDFKSEIILGEQRQNKNGEIAYIFGVDVPSDEYLQKENELLEICEFTHEKHTFQGSFIDALKYIQKAFKSEKI